MRKKGFTLVELIISMTVLSLILVAVASVFSVSIRTYQVESQRSMFQKELNFVTDAVSRDIKQSRLVQNYNPYILSSTTLILNLPSIDDSEGFIYSGGVPLTDTIVYYRSGASFYKVTFANPASRRAHGGFFGITWKMIDENITNVSFTYSPSISAARSVSFTITESAMVGKKNVILTAKSTANLRNR